jgi:hypothetical protein
MISRKKIQYAFPLQTLITIPTDTLQSGPLHPHRPHPLLNLRYDRAGRSDGTAFVTYEFLSDARLAIREFDGANAKGQPIRLTSCPPPPAEPSAEIHSIPRKARPESRAHRSPEG